MSNLNRHIQAKQDKLNQLESTLQTIQAQLAALAQELRVEQQLAKAQESIAKEFFAVKGQVAKIVKDACSCYEPEALDDMLLDITEVIQAVKDEYESYSQSDRFLDAEVATIEDSEISDTAEVTTHPSDEMPLLAMPTPDKDNNTEIISGANILVYSRELGLDLEALQRIQASLGIPGKYRKIENISTAISKASLTAVRFHSIAELIKPQSLAITNGKTS